MKRPPIDRILGDLDFDLLTEEERSEFLRLMDTAIGPQWTLTPKQEYANAIWHQVDWLLYGGAAGGGKSDFACHHVNELSLRIPGHNSLLVRQSIPELRRSLILRLITRIRQFKLPARYRKLDGQAGFQYTNGSLIECGHCATDEDVGKYLSAEYDCMVIDEASQLTPDQIVQLSARLRTTRDKAMLGARPHLGLFTNPGDVAHAWLYDTFVTATNYGQQVVVYDVSQGLERMWPVRTYEAPINVRDATEIDILDTLVPWARNLNVETDPATQLAVAFVPAKATDNPHIDPSYLKFLNALPERRRRQLRDGDWDTFEGQFFESYSRATHVIEPFEIPEGWTKARGLDYGSTAPYCCLWGAWDNDGNCYIYREDYEAGLTPDMQARRVVSRSVDGNNRREKFQATVADPSVFSDRRGTGRSIADMWRDCGLHTTRAKNQRIAGWANVRQYLWDAEKPDSEGRFGAPRMYIFNTCTNLTRTIALQQHDKRQPEDLDTNLEDHAVDALRYLLAVRPLNEIHRRRIPPVGMEARWQQMLRKADKRKRPTTWK